MKQLSLLILSGCVLFACDKQNKDTGQQAQYCQQAVGFMDKAQGDTSLSPRDWGNLMLAGARLVYVTHECGDRVREPKEQLCVTLNNMLQVYVENPMVPAGKNRDTAISQSSDVYQRANCSPSLNIN
ncbi:MAG: hypothetical protein GY779_12365 [Gammaproteobacteria bacterium]|nr:hypothetical protein [Gammaproteobacteria bacterium]